MNDQKQHYLTAMSVPYFTPPFAGLRGPFELAPDNECEEITLTICDDMVQDSGKLYQQFKVEKSEFDETDLSEWLPNASPRQLEMAKELLEKSLLTKPVITKQKSTVEWKTNLPPGLYAMAPVHGEMPPWLTHGKMYLVTSESQDGEVFHALSDTEIDLTCRWKSSCHIRGKDWKRVVVSRCGVWPEGGLNSEADTWAGVPE